MPLEIFKELFKRSAPEQSRYFHPISRPETYRSGKWDNRLLSPEEMRVQAFDELRERTHAEMEKQVAERIKNNPHPTEEELWMGAFVEQLEPQVRDVVLTFRRKGYNAFSSGFYCEGKQNIDGPFTLDKETKAKLAQFGVGVHEMTKANDKNIAWYTGVYFFPEKPDLDEMKQTWDRIAGVLPDRGRIAGAPLNAGATRFRRKYAPNIDPYHPISPRAHSPR
jgi:hypothetical protein